MPIHVLDADYIRTVIIENTGRANALNADILMALTEAFDSAEHDPGVRAIVLTGAGEHFFCAGMDLKERPTTLMSSGSSNPPSLFSERFYAKPVIGAINGSAVGGGLGLVLACDVAISVQYARFGIPEVQRGLIGAGVVSRAAIRLAPAAALELALVGDLIDAKRALTLGIVNRIVTSDDLIPESMATAQRIAANAPLAVAATKKLIFEAATLTRVDMASLREGVAHVAASADAQEGITAFREGRVPHFVGE